MGTKKHSGAERTTSAPCAAAEALDAAGAAAQADAADSADADDECIPGAACYTQATACAHSGRWGQASDSSARAAWQPRRRWRRRRWG